MDPAIESFFRSRREERLKNKRADEVDAEFDLDNWIPKAARAVGGYSLSTHPPGFSHPDAGQTKVPGGVVHKTSCLIVDAPERNDGYLRSRKKPTKLNEIDAYGNAAFMGYYAFLMLEMEDGKTLLSHIESDSLVAREILTRKTASYEELKAGFLRIKEAPIQPVTHVRIKQVYFPVEGKGYHQLSILTPSVLMFKMKRQIDSIRFPSDEVKEIRNARREEKFSESGYTTLTGLTEVGYGGTKPQNISLLNSKNRGRAYLLRSVPPELQHDYGRLPKRDFFRTHLRYRPFQENFDSLRKLVENDINNIHIREGRDRRVRVIFDEIVRIVWKLRSQDAGWSDGELYSALPRFQKIVLDSMYNNAREHHEAELEMFLMNIARWIIEGYKATAKTNPPLLADQELVYVLRVVSEKKEALL